MAVRAPLAPFPNGTSRLSMAPQRKSNAPAPPRQSMAPALARQSMAPIGAPRASIANDGRSRQSSISSYTGRKSLGPRPSGTKVTQDPRNVSDKSVMRQYINNIIEYLAEHAYTRQISPKMLAAPSSKDFASILEFLYQEFDPGFTIVKPEEDVVTIFKTLKYPIPISKRNIGGAIGAPHTWPPFLAALNWLVELLRAQQFANDPMLENDGFMNEGPDDKQFFEFICKSYPSWLDGNDETVSLDEELQQNFDNRNRTNRTEIDNFNAIKEEVTAETESIINAGDRVEAATKKKHTLEADVQKFMGFCDKLLVAIQEARTRLNDCNKEVEAREGELAGTVNEKGRLQGVIVSQEQQSIDVSKINARKQTLNDNLDVASNTKDRIDKNNWDDEMKLSKKMDDIDKLLEQYHQLAARLQLVGPDTKNANGINYQISFDRHSVTYENGISSEIKHTIKPACKNLLIEISDKIRTVQAEILREKEEEKQLQETTQDKREDLKTLESKLKKLETSLQKEKEKASDEVKQMEANIERLTQEVSNMRESAKAAQVRSSNTLEAVRLEYNKQTQKMDQETQARRDKILHTADALAKHKEWMTKHFEELHEYVRNDYTNSVKHFDAAVTERMAHAFK